MNLTLLFITTFASFLISNADSTRSPKKLFKKIHDGVTFLAGVKFGTYLAHKGLYTGLGQGSIATSHNFRLFGKTINSALSLTYGDIPIGLPVLQDPIEPDGNASSKGKPPPPPSQHLLVTVLDPDEIKEDPILPDRRKNTTELKGLAKIVQDHNNLVKDFNAFNNLTSRDVIKETGNMTRINSKIL